jgi:hypothetical protein
MTLIPMCLVRYMAMRPPDFTATLNSAMGSSCCASWDSPSMRGCWNRSCQT